MKLISYLGLRNKGIEYQRDHLRRKCKADEFPKPIALSARRIAWVEQEVDDWIAERAARRGGVSA